MGGVSFPGKRHYEGIRFNIISVTRGWVEVKFPGEKHYVTLEWLRSENYLDVANECHRSTNLRDPFAMQLKYLCLKIEP